jgi:hypothetical protein
MKRLALIAAPTLILLAAGSAAAFDHAPFDGLLRAHVRGGRVDYAALKARGARELDAYLAAVARAELRGLSRPAQLAFYLNAYNALVIGEVVRRWPGIRSVKAVAGFFDKQRHRVAGASLTLNDLENKLIRPRFKDARIHFALVCAARSCPPLPSRAFDPRTLEQTLDGLARDFIRSPAGVRIAGGELRASRLFEWYEADFRESAGSVLGYLARYHPLGKQLASGKLRLAFLDYDWALNGR